jgi:aryl-alcohol dehydrogenase-like predicted oxidoreductase
MHATLDAGIRTFDTARAYALDERDLGHNERLVAQAIKGRTGVATRVITKCGMRREGSAWIPDGRARSILEDATASVEALGGVPIDVLLLHAPDPRVPMVTSARALARAQADGLARSVGVSNVSRKQLEEAASEAPISAVEVALGAYDDLAMRAGVVAFCIEGAAAGRVVEVALCAHPGGRPICWCRPPLPALLLAFAHRHRIDLHSPKGNSCNFVPCSQR